MRFQSCPVYAFLNNLLFCKCLQQILREASCALVSSTTRIFPISLRPQRLCGEPCIFWAKSAKVAGLSAELLQKV
jgi:hypothetical protein